MNTPKPTLRKEEDMNDEGLTHVSLRKRGGRKQDNQEVNKKILVSNKFGALEDQPEETPAQHQGK